MNKFRLPEFWRLILSIGMCQFAGIIGSLFTTPQIPTWYASLQKPGFNPPNWIFGPVWITLYTLMGVAMFLVWRQYARSAHAKSAIETFVVQLLLNILWSVVFFGLKSPLGGLVIILLLWIAILATIIRFQKVSEIASFLLIPYILWVTFAALLNFAIFRLNP
ncbi:MAG: tryptophan-rich sensory protein [candidate division WOR-3 bacterium]|nr:MAG: tryptophan-rich sensory protein [candidate division WOR-3 bacterium]